METTGQRRTRLERMAIDVLRSDLIFRVATELQRSDLSERELRNCLTIYEDWYENTYIPTIFDDESIENLVMELSNQP